MKSKGRAWFSPLVSKPQVSAPECLSSLHSRTSADSALSCPWRGRHWVGGVVGNSAHKTGGLDVEEEASRSPRGHVGAAGTLAAWLPPASLNCFQLEPDKPTRGPFFTNRYHLFTNTISLFLSLDGSQHVR